MKICLSYSREDKLIARGVLFALHEYGPSDMEVWYDRRVQPGADWNDEIQRHFGEADAYVVVASKSYFSSDYILDFELRMILDRASAGEAQLFWIPLDREPQAFREFELGEKLTDFQAIPFDPSSDGDEVEAFYRRMMRDVQRAIARRQELKPADDTPSELELFRGYVEAVRAQVARLTTVERAGGERWFPFEQLFVTLTADFRPLSDREAGRQLLHKEIDIRAMSAHGEAAATANVIAERERDDIAEESETDDDRESSLEKVFANTRHLVVRGNPGSGKTVLCCYLAAQLLKSADLSRRSRASASDAAARIPILIPIRQFAAWHSDTGKRGTLTAFLGSVAHVRIDGISPTHVHDFLSTQIKDKKSVVLLDGLDEVQISQRPSIVKAIESFVREHIPPSASADATPERIGGNQIVITSRVAGYDLAPVTLEPFRHFTIRPFDEEAKVRFCRNWAEICYRGDKTKEARLRRHVLEDSPPAIQQLASNPLLLRILCELSAPLLAADSRGEPQPLPPSRAAIYEQAVEAMGRRWRDAARLSEKSSLAVVLERRKLFDVLSAIARDMHERKLITSITADGCGEVFQRVFGKAPFYYSPDEAVRLQRDLIELLRTHVGVFAERAPDVFGFLHLTFQEYLAGYGLCLTTDGKWQSAEQLANDFTTRVADPSWREPLLLAFGQLGQWLAEREGRAPAPASVLELLEEKLAAEEGLLSSDEAAIFFADLVFELPDDQLNAPHVRHVLESLLRRYAQWGSREHSSAQRERLAEAVAALRRRLISQDANGIPAADIWMADLMEREPTLAAPVAYLVRDRSWYTVPIMRALVDHLQLDDPAWQWPMHGALRETCIDQPLVSPVAKKLERPPARDKAGQRARLNYEIALKTWKARKVRESERTRKPELPLQPRMRAFFASNPLAGARLDQTIDARRVMAALFGGFQDWQSPRLLREYRDLALLLQKGDETREAAIASSPELFDTRWGNEDAVYEIAVYLDKLQGGLGQYRNRAAQFRSEWIVRNCGELSHEIVEDWLSGRGSAADVRQRFRAMIAARDSGSAEAALAYIAIGENISDIVVTPQLRSQLNWLLGRTMDDLRDPVLRTVTATDATIWPLLDAWLSTLPDADASVIFGVVIDTLVVAGQVPVEPKLTYVGGPLLNRRVRAEQWAWAFAGANGDDVAYQFAVALDSLSVGKTMDEVVSTVAAIARSANGRLLPFKRVHRALWGIGENQNFPTPIFVETLDLLCRLADRLDPEFGDGFAGRCLLPGQQSVYAAALRGDAVLDIPKEGTLWWQQELHVGTLPARDRAILIVRRAAIDREGQRKELMLNALRSAAEVAEPAWRAEFLHHTRRLAIDIGCQDEHAAQAADLPPILRAFALGELAALLCHRDGPYAGELTDGWIAITTYAVCHERMASAESADDEDDLWEELQRQMTSPRLTAIVDRLIEKSGEYGLFLTDKAEAAIGSLRTAEDTPQVRDAVRRLLPVIRQFVPEESHRLRVWINDESDGTHSNLAQHAALLLAERTRALEETWLEKIAALAAGDHVDDLTDARARLVLGTRYVYLPRTDREYKLSLIGPAVYVRLLELSALHTPRPYATNWFRGCVRAWAIDNAEALGEILDTLETRGDDGLPLFEQLLSGGQEWSSSCLETMASWLEVHPGVWGDAWLMWYCLVCRLQKEIPETLHQIARARAQRFGSVTPYFERHESYRVVSEACASAVQIGSVSRAKEVLQASLPHLDATEPPEVWIERCKAAGDALLQFSNEVPEDCADVVELHLDSEEFFDLTMNWLEEALSSWSENRRRAGATVAVEHKETIINALLSIATIVSEHWPERFAKRTLERRPGRDFPSLVAEAAGHHSRHRSRQAAITLLSRMFSLPVDLIYEVFDIAMRDTGIVRIRTLQLLPRFRALEVESFVEEALKGFAAEQPASRKLAKAELLVSLLERNIVRDPDQRRKIMKRLEFESQASVNIRPLAYLAGDGSENDPRSVEIVGRLDLKLQGLLSRATMRTSRF